MQEIGDLLREARESRGMSLEDVENATMIRRKYLEAIESGDASQVPGEVQLRGFIRNYAAAVGLDPDGVMDQYRESRGSMDSIDENVLKHSKTEILVVEERKSSRFVLVIVAVLVLLLIVAGALYYFLIYRNPQNGSAATDLLKVIGLEQGMGSESVDISSNTAIVDKT